MEFIKKHSALLATIWFIIFTLPSGVVTYLDLWQKYKEANMPPLGMLYWLLPAIGIAPLIFAYFYDRKRNNQLEDKTNTAIPQKQGDNLVNKVSVSKIERQEPSKQLPLYFNVILFILMVITLTFGVFSLVQLIRGVLHPQITNLLSAFQWLLFYACFIGVPFFMIFNILIWERQRKKLGESLVAKKTFIIVDADRMVDVFKKCQQVLERMKAGHTN